jgi:hypothetical protein
MFLHTTKIFASGAFQSVAGVQCFGLALVHVIDSGGHVWWRLNTPWQIDQKEWWVNEILLSKR